MMEELEATTRIDPCLEDQLAGVPPEYSRCYHSSSFAQRNLDSAPAIEPSTGGSLTGCPNGCTYDPPGCDIKGNISASTGAKIRRVPGQEYCSETIIRSEYGGRWFCTEAEAVSNSWRKAEV